MNKFQDVCSSLSRSSGPEREASIKEMEKKCICPDCPTYTSCASAESELLYCFNGGSSCINDKKRCVCPDCPIYESAGLSNKYYCTNGSEAERVS